MALFEFKCGDCEHKFEFLTSSTAKAPDRCPKCGSAKVEKQLSAFAVGGSSASSAPQSRCESCPSASGGGCPYSRQ